MRKLAFILLGPLLFLGITTAPGIAQGKDPSVLVQNKTFTGFPIAFFGENMLFDSGRSYEIVPATDTTITVDKGKSTFALRGVAELTRFHGFLNKPVDVYTLSGNGKHSPLWQSVAGSLSNFSSGFFSPAVQEMKAIWVDKDHITHTVVTPRKRGETIKKLIARHKELVDAYKAV